MSEKNILSGKQKVSHNTYNVITHTHTSTILAPMKAGFLAAHYKGLGDGGGKGSHAHRPFMPLFGKAFVSLWPSYPPQMSKNGPSLRTYSRIEQLSRTLTLRIKD